jgi:hypothetical protein
VNEEEFMISIFLNMRELVRLGELTTEPSYHPGMGQGERYLYKGKPTKLIPSFIGNTRNLGAAPIEFKDPHDILISEETGDVITYARS